jgi:beta-glucosidase
VGEVPYAEGVGDSDELWLSESHKQLIQECSALGKPLVVVLISGRALIVNDEINLSDAFVAAWLPGSEGAGVADFLFSIDGFTPTGKLPHAWPASVEHLPLGVGDKRALYPFGYGLQRF